MFEEHRKLLVKNITTISDRLFCIPQVLNGLVAKDVFVSDVIAEVLAESTRYAQATKIVILLTKTTENGFSVFLQTLRNTKQDALADHLFWGKFN